MSRWRRVRLDTILAIHDRQIAQHGGLDGLRDRGALDATLHRPQHLADSGEPDLADSAAALCWGLARNHCFADGNKRTAWVAARLFLADNGAVLAFDPAEAVRLVEGVAAGSVAQMDLAEWFRRRIAIP